MCLPHDWLTWRLRRQHRGTATHHRPQRCQRHGLLVTGHRRLPARPADASHSATRRYCRRSSARAPRRAPRPAASGSWAGAGDNAASALGLGAPAPAMSSSRSAPPGWSARCRASRRPMPAARSPDSPTPPAASCRWPAPSTGRRVLQTPPRAARRRSRSAQRSRPGAPAGAEGVALVPYFDGERTPNRPDATGPCTASPAPTPQRPPRPGRVRGPAVRTGRLPGRAARTRRAGPSTAAGRRRRALPALRAMAPAVLDVGPRSPNRASMSRWGRPVRRPGWLPGPPAAGLERPPGGTADRPMPLSSANRYLDARDLTLSRVGN